MDSEAADAGIAAAREFIAAFNAQDHERLAAALNYPHIRLANGAFARIDSAAEFAERSERGKRRLAEEGWHDSVIERIEVVQAAADKVHLVMTVLRRRADGTVYNSFETLWIATLQADESEAAAGSGAGHWGIQFRSSYLR